MERFDEAMHVIGPLVRGERVRFAGRDHAADGAEDRDRASLRRTIGVNVDEPEGEPSIALDEVPRAIEAHAALGVDDVPLGGGWATDRTLDRLAELLDLRRAEPGRGSRCYRAVPPRDIV